MSIHKPTIYVDPESLERDPQTGNVRVPDLGGVGGPGKSDRLGDPIEPTKVGPAPPVRASLPHVSFPQADPSDAASTATGAPGDFQTHRDDPPAPYHPPHNIFGGTREAPISLDAYAAWRKPVIMDWPTVLLDGPEGAPGKSGKLSGPTAAPWLRKTWTAHSRRHA